MSNFYFGAALSAHQAEGNNTTSDWWDFEKNVLKAPEFQSGQATNHYQLYEEDFKLASQLGHNAHRFSIEWARIEPEEGQINYEAVEHYKKVFESLAKYKLTPFVTIHHFTLPKWFADKGGFLKKNNIIYFLNFCKFIGTEFREEMCHIIVFNEPDVYSYHGYLLGKWPPRQKKFFQYTKVLKNITIAHRLAYDALKAIKPEFSIGISKNNMVYRPDSAYSPLDWVLLRIINFHWNFSILNKIKNHLDFIGLNYYFYRSVKADISLLSSFGQYSYPTSRKTDMNWEVYPKGLYVTTKELYKRYKLPIIITENGVADRADKLREDAIREGLYWLFKSKAEGTDIFGYLHWALTDNFEWDSGFDPKFGLIKIDYKDFSRSVRPSALIYRDLIKKYQKKMTDNPLNDNNSIK